MQEAMDDNEDDGDIFLDESDILDEITLDNEDLPDANEDYDYDDHDEDDSSDEMPVIEPDEDSIHVFKGHKRGVFAVACSPTDASLVASGGRDDKAFLWRVGSQNDSQTELAGHKDTVSSLAFSSDGQLLASGGCDACVKIWDMSGNLKYTFDGPDEGNEFEWVKWHPTQNKVLASSTDDTGKHSTVWLWNADDGSFLNVFQGHRKAVTCGDFSPDGETICTGSMDALNMWNFRSGERHAVIDYSSGVSCLTFTSDSACALTGSDDGFVRVVHIPTRKVVNHISSHSDQIHCIGLSSSLPWVATGGEDRKLVIQDLEHSAHLNVCEHEGSVTCLKWLGESRFVACGCKDGKVVIWDTRSGECARMLGNHSKWIQELSVSANQEFLVSASEDGTARAFNISQFT